MPRTGIGLEHERECFVSRGAPQRKVLSEERVVDAVLAFGVIQRPRQRVEHH